MNEPNKLDKDMYFNQPPDGHVREEVVSVNDPNNIVNLSNKVHSPEISTGTVKKVVAEDIDRNLINNIPNETEVNKNPVESVKDILKEVPAKSPEEMTGGGRCKTDGGALSFNASNLPKTAGALAFNDEELVKQLSALKKNDRVGSGALATAAITSLISVAPQIIKAISDLKKGKTVVGEGSAIYMKDLSPDKYDQMEALMKQIKNQKNNFKFDSVNNEYVVGTGKFGDFMSKAWNKVKEIYGSEAFKPIRNALLNAASNTATKAINKVADKAVSKVQNEDLKNIINVTRETAQNAKDNLLESQKASGCEKKSQGISQGQQGIKKGGRSSDADRYLSTQNKAAVFEKLANDELASDSCEEDELTDPKNIFKKKSMDVHPGLPNSKTIVGKYKKVRARSVFL